MNHRILQLGRHDNNREGSGWHARQCIPDGRRGNDDIVCIAQHRCRAKRTRCQLRSRCTGIYKRTCKECVGNASIIDAVAGTERGLTVAKYIPGKAGTGAEIVFITGKAGRLSDKAIRLILRISSLTGCQNSGRRVWKLRLTVALIIISQPKVKSYMRTDAPVILDKESIIRG